MDDEKITLELTISEAFALKDAVTCLWCVHHGLDASPYRAPRGPDVGHLAQLAHAERVADRVEVGLKSTQSHRDAVEFVRLMQAQITD